MFHEVGFTWLHEGVEARGWIRGRGRARCCCEVQRVLHSVEALQSLLTLFNSNSCDVRHGPPADVWACGVVLHILLVGYAPFTGRTERETLDRSVRGEYAMDPLDWARISQDARDLVSTK